MRTKPGSRRVSSRFLVIGFISATAVAYGAWRATHPPIGEDAKGLLNAVLDGKPGRVVDFSSSEELRHLGLDRRRAIALLDELVVPRVKWATRYGPVQLEIAQAKDRAQATQSLRGSGGRVFNVSSEVFPTADGSKTCAIFSALVKAWTIAYHHDQSGPPKLSDMFTACRVGFQKDRAVLEKYGLKGFYSASKIPWMPRHFRTFAEYEAHWERMEVTASP